jgi:PhzF family phenazine biosynthesis protein
MQRIAAENNMSETAFLVKEKDHYGLRWFTPTTEVALCGHATLASAHVLFEHEGFRGTTIRFQTRSGKLTAARKGQDIELDLPAACTRRVPIPGILGDALVRIPLETYKSKTWIMAVYGTQEDVQNIQPRMTILEAIRDRAVIVTARGKKADFVSRFFAPRLGVPEDPVTGSAHAILAPFWSRRLGKTELEAIQLSGRGGRLRCTVVGNRVKMAGRSVTYLKGSIEV